MSRFTKFLKTIGLHVKQRQTINTFTGISQINLIGIGAKQFIKDGYKANPMLFAIINWITKRASKVEWQLLDVTNPKEPEEVFDHDYLTLLNHPNPMQSKREFYESAIGYKKITGETFIHGVSPENGINMGIPKEMWVIPSPIMEVEFDGVGMPSGFAIVGVGRSTEVPVEQMMYLREFNPGENNRGLSPIEAGAKVVSMSNDAYEANMRLLQNAGAKGILSLDDDASVTQEQLDVMETKMNEKYGGASAYGKKHISNLKWKWQQIGLSAKDLVLIETHSLNREDMCNMYQLPTELFNDKESSTFNNVQEARKTGLTDAVLPEIDSLRDGFDIWLTPLFNERDKKKYKLVHNKKVYPELQKNMKELVEWLAPAWWFTGNQKLEAMDMPTSENPLMDDILLPTNLVPTGEPEDLEKAHARFTRTKNKESDVA